MPPDVMFEEALEETNFHDMNEYSSVIGVLRDKGFSYRDIAEWMTVRGLDVDHNAVYRIYINSLSDYDAAMEAEREDEEAREDALRNT